MSIIIKYKGVDITAFKYRGIDIPNIVFHGEELLGSYIGITNVIDAFDRPDSNAGLGLSDSGHNWIPIKGVMGILSNKAYAHTLEDDFAGAVIEYGKSDGDFKARVTMGEVAGNNRLIVRYKDYDNFIGLTVQHYFVILYKKVNGVYFGLGNLTGWSNPGDHNYMIRLKGTTIELYLDGVFKSSHIIAEHVNETKHGFLSYKGSSIYTYDNFSIAPIPIIYATVIVKVMGDVNSGTVILNSVPIDIGSEASIVVEVGNTITLDVTAEDGYVYTISPNFVSTISGNVTYTVAFVVPYVDSVIEPHINLMSYSPDRTGAVDSSAQWASAIAAAESGGTRLLVVPFGTYLIDSQVDVANSLKIISDGGEAVIKRGSSTYTAISFNYFSNDIYQVSNLTTNTITLSSVAGLAIGDVIKIYSNDSYGDRTLTESKLGEHLVISDIDGNIITVSSNIKYAYATTIKVIRLSDKTAEMHNIKLTAIDNPTYITANIIEVNGGKNHIFNDMIVSICPETGIRFRGCYGHQINNFHCEFQLDKTVNGGEYIGYGIVDSTGANYIIDGMTSNRVRHAYTSGSDTGGSPELYGLSENGIIRNSNCDNDTTASFDTHDESDNIVFDNCIARNTSLAYASGYGFQLRGTNHKILNGKAFGTNGLSLLNVTNTTGVYLIEDCVFNVTGTTLAINMESPSWASDIIFNRCTFVGGPMIVSKAKIAFNDCIIAVDRIQTYNVMDIIFNNCATDIANEIRCYSDNSKITFNGGTLKTAFRIQSSMEININDCDMTYYGNIFKVNTIGKDVSVNINSTSINFTVKNYGLFELVGGDSTNSLTLNAESLELINSSGLSTISPLVLWRDGANANMPVILNINPLIKSSSFLGSIPILKVVPPVVYADVIDNITDNIATILN